MSKYNALWSYIKKTKEEVVKLSFDEIEKIVGLPLDHSFLQYKKELIEYGWKVNKTSLKEKTVIFERIKDHSQDGKENNL